MIKLVAGPLDKCCDVCPGGITKMRQIPRTNSWVCSVCSGSDWHYPSIGQAEQTAEEEYIIE